MRKEGKERKQLEIDKRGERKIYDREKEEVGGNEKSAKKRETVTRGECERGRKAREGEKREKLKRGRGKI